MAMDPRNTHSRRQRSRKPRLPAPATRAACITRDRPKAKSKSSPERKSITGIVSAPSPRHRRSACASLRRPSAAASAAWMSTTTSPDAIAPSTLWKPVTTHPALLARARAWRRSMARSASMRSARSVGAFTEALKARANALRRKAASTASRRALTQAPRPGRRSFRSGTTSPCGLTAKRMSSSGSRTSRVAIQVRRCSRRGTQAPPSPPCGGPWSSCPDRPGRARSPVRFHILSGGENSIVRSRRGCLRHLFRPAFITFDGLDLLGWRVDPAGTDAGFHDHAFGISARQIEPVEEAGMAHGFGTATFRIADEIIGCTSGKVLDVLDIVPAQSNQHCRGDAVDLAQFVGNTKLAAFGVVLFLDPLEIFPCAGLDFLRGLLVEALDIGHLVDLDIGDFLN